MQTNQSLTNSKAVVLCSYCSKSATKLCERCGDFYCSIQCQLNDWQRHRYICIPLPRLLPIAKFGQNYLTNGNRLPLASQNNTFNSVNSYPIDETTSKPESCVYSEIVQTDQKTSQSSISLPSSIDELEQTIRNESRKLGPIVVTIQSGTIVRIANVIDCQAIIVYPVTEPNQYQQLVTEISISARDAEPFTKEAQNGDLVLAPMPQEGIKYGRAILIDFEEDQGLVEFLDFGNTKVVERKDLKCLPKEFMHRAQLINRIKLQYKQPLSSSTRDEIVKYLKQLKSSGTEFTLKYSSVNLENRPESSVTIDGELINLTTNGSLSEHLGNWKEDLVPKEPSIKSSKDKKPIEKAKIVENHAQIEQKTIEYTELTGKNISAVILDTSLLKIGCWTVVEKTNLSKFYERDYAINAYCEQMQNVAPFYPAPEEVCLAQRADQRWYRVTCWEKVDAETFTMIFIDYGYIEKINAKYIRPIHEKLMFPCVTVNCCLDGVTSNAQGSLSKELVNELRNHLVDSNEIVISEATFDAEDVCATCKIPAIVEAIRKKKLI